MVNPSISDTSDQTELLVESVNIRLATQKLDQRLHLILTSTSLKNSMPVSPTLPRAHWISLECSMKHVGRVNLGTI